MTALAIMQLLPKMVQDEGQIIWKNEEDLTALPPNKMRETAPVRPIKTPSIFNEDKRSRNNILAIIKTRIGELTIIIEVLIAVVLAKPSYNNNLLNAIPNAAAKAILK